MDSATVPRFRRVRKAAGAGFLAVFSASASIVVACRA